jgi:hypothetical protein
MTRVPSRGRWGVIAVAAAVVLVPSVASADGVRTRLVQWGMLPTDASFSELSLLHDEELEKTVSLTGRTRFAVAATNASPRTRRYSWSATVGPEGSPIRVDGGTFSLAGGRSKQVTVGFEIPNCGVRNKVAVRLTTPGQRSAQVHYWVLPHGSEAWMVSRGPSCAA